MPGVQLVRTLIPAKNVPLVTADLSLINASISKFLIMQANENQVTRLQKKKKKKK